MAPSIPNFKGSTKFMSPLFHILKLKLCVFMPPLFLIFKGSYVMSPYFQILKFQVCVFMPPIYFLISKVPTSCFRVSLVPKFEVPSLHFP
jgi:hypothetical protein